MEKQIVITDSYMFSVGKLNNQERKQATNTIKQMREDITIPSLSVHAINREKCDSKFRSARVNSDIRLIFYVDGEYCTLLYIDHHDAAYDWCVGKYCKKTDFGATYIFDILKEEENLSKYGQNSVDDENEDDYYVSSLEKNGITEKQLTKIGIPKVHAVNLLKIKSEDIFVDYIDMFPEEIQEALMDLYVGEKTFENVYNDLIDNGESSVYEADPNQSLLQKDSRRRFYVTQSMDELEYLMENEKFEKWTTFLHPSQEKLVKINANGPVLVEGGPGTGKTVLGLHRAAYLSEKIFKESDNCKILFCTFSVKLSRYISSNMDKLFAQKGIKGNVDVCGVDYVINQLLGDETIPVVKQSEFNELIKKVYRSQKWEYSLDFYLYEYYQIIERYGIVNEDSYLHANRTGMGVGLNENQRKKVWLFFKNLFKEQRERGISTFVNRAEKLNMLYKTGKKVPEYDAIIIDEAQDLEPCKLRALLACVKDGPNSVMILSDNNQRIFNLRSWRSDVGVNVVGRTYYLYINYRTTKEISDYASVMFFKGQEKNEYMKSYKSIVKGNEPIVQGYKNDEKQWEAIVSTIKALIETGNNPNEICVVFPTNNELEKFEKVLSRYQIDYVVLKGDIVPSDMDKVCLCNVKGVKGLEFSSVIISSSERFGTSLVDKYVVDETAELCYQKQVDCERYVAATRARDNLFVTYVEE